MVEVVWIRICKKACSSDGGDDVLGFEVLVREGFCGYAEDPDWMSRMHV